MDKISKMSVEERIYKTINEGNRINREQSAAVDQRLSTVSEALENDQAEINFDNEVRISSLELGLI